jgi:hypothetical protein
MGQEELSVSDASKSDTHDQVDNQCNNPADRGADEEQRSSDQKTRSNRSADNEQGFSTNVDDGNRSSQQQISRRYLVHQGRRKNYDNFARYSETTQPMNFHRRVWNSIKASLRCRGTYRGSNQYRIPPRDEFSFAPLQLINRITEGAVVNWTFLHYRTSFMCSILLFLLVYIILVYAFAFWIRGATYRGYEHGGEECLPGFNYEIPGQLVHNFNIGFALSWATFSTVGYGDVSVPVDVKCRELRFLLASEAFIGILYIGFCGAICMAKISRNYVTAPVTFSSATCLQYGTKVIDMRSEAGTNDTNLASAVNANGETVSEDSENNEDELTSFPFLEFRVVNTKANHMDAEITDAKVKCVVVSIRLIGRIHNRRASEMSGVEFNLNENVMQQEELGRGAWTQQRIPNVKRTYRQMSLNCSTHPRLGNGAWHLRHTLDQKSPFLRGNVRRRIEELGGWPASWNNHGEMRKKLNPDIYEFSVIFTGTSNRTANDVFKAQTWKTEDIYIGWQFVSTSYLDKKNKKDDGKRHWKDDLSLIHDIVPQEHTSCEPLSSRTSENNVLQFLSNLQLSEDN